MLVASKKKIDQILFPTVDYHHESMGDKGENKKITSTIGFYEIEKRKIVRDDGHKRVTGDVLKEIFVPTTDEHTFAKVPYSGKTLMISIKNSPLTTTVREAIEEDKIKYKEAYEAHLAEKAKDEARNAELNAMKKQLEELEAKKAKKDKE